jgi:hypothetical protein
MKNFIFWKNMAYRSGVSQNNIVSNSRVYPLSQTNALITGNVYASTINLPPGLWCCNVNYRVASGIGAGTITPSLYTLSLTGIPSPLNPTICAFNLYNQGSSQFPIGASTQDTRQFVFQLTSQTTVSLNQSCVFVTTGGVQTFTGVLGAVFYQIA